VKEVLTAANDTDTAPANNNFTQLLSDGLAGSQKDQDGYFLADRIIRDVGNLQAKQRITSYAWRMGFTQATMVFKIPQQQTAAVARPTVSGEQQTASSGSQTAASTDQQTTSAEQQTASINQGKAPVLGIAPTANDLRSGPVLINSTADRCKDSVLVKNNVKDGAVGQFGIGLGEDAVIEDWDAVVKANVRFVYIVASYGARGQNEKFYELWRKAGEAGLLRIAHHVFNTDPNPRESPDEQVKNFLSAFGGLSYGPCDLPPSVAWFGDYNPSITKSAVPRAQAVLRGIQDAIGMQPLFYTTTDSWPATEGIPEELTEYPLWIGDWAPGSNSGPRSIAGQSNWVMWLDKTDFKVPGAKRTGMDQGFVRTMYRYSLRDLKNLTKFRDFSRQVAASR
jgi:hypothetical protein